ncbi:MAG: GNAT family N-acetyltransferase [Coriobacteriia bacterium]
MSGLTIETMDTPAAFAELREEWDALAATADTVFLTHPWLSNWISLLANGSEPHVLVARDGGTLVAALPLVKEVHGPGVRVVRFMGSGTLTPNHLDVLSYREHRQAALSGFVERLLADRCSWDVLDLDKLPEDTGTASMLRDAFSAAGLPVSLSRSAVCPYAQLPPTYDEFFASLSKSARRHTRERIRCIGREHPEARFGRVRTEEELGRALDTLVTLHQERWRARGYAGSFADPRVVAFHHAVCRESLRTGCLRFYTLTEGERVMAAVLCYRVNGTVQAYSCAFEPQWSAYRPGMLLGGYAIEQSIAEGATRFDHLEGDEAHKSTWAGGKRNNVRFRAFGRSIRGCATHAATALHEQTVMASRRYLPAEFRESVVKSFDRFRTPVSARKKASAVVSAAGYKTQTTTRDASKFFSIQRFGGMGGRHAAGFRAGRSAQTRK